MMFNNNNGGYSLSDIAAATGNANNGGFGSFNGDGAWIFLLFILILMGGWGNGYGWNNGGGNGGASITADVNADIQRGFDQSAIVGGINGITAALNTGFSGAEISRCNAQANLSTQLNTIAMNQQNCCCENRAGLADLKYTVATEACADRAAVTDALRDVIASNTANTQAILDKLCEQEIESLKAQNQQLQMQSYLANLAASQNAQTGQILNDNAAQTTALLRVLNPAPVPAYVVPNPFGCNCNNGCGCGNNGFYN